VLYIDRPAPDQPLGLWALDAEASEPAPVLYSERLATLSQNSAFWVFRDNLGLAAIERVSDGEQWRIDTEGFRPNVSPNGRLVAWTNTSGQGPYDQQRTAVVLAQVGYPYKGYPLVTVWGGGFAGWLADSESLLVVGRPRLDTRERELNVVSLATGETTLLLREERIGGVLPSPDGKWVLATVTFSADPAHDGLWLLATSGEEPRKLRSFGSYQWRDARRFVYVPLRGDPSASHVLYQYDVLSREHLALTDPALMPFTIAGNDWAVSPDGRRLAFVSGGDQAVWVLDLP
jgi:hypothetical protein